MAQLILRAKHGVWLSTTAGMTHAGMGQSEKDFEALMGATVG